MTAICENCKKPISEWEKKRPEMRLIYRMTGVYFCVKCATKLIQKAREKEGKRK